MQHVCNVMVQNKTNLHSVQPHLKLLSAENSLGL